MPTINQLLKSLRILKKKKNKTPALRGNPQKRAECVKVFTKNPKKPNSAIRKVTKIRIEFRLKKITSFDEVKNPKESIYTEAYIPGEGHTLKQQNIVLVRGGRTPDLPGIKYRLIRGKFSFEGLQTRKTSRSLYGTKRAFTTTVFDSSQTIEELEILSEKKGAFVFAERKIRALKGLGLLKSPALSSEGITDGQIRSLERLVKRISLAEEAHVANVEAQKRWEEKLLASKIFITELEVATNTYLSMAIELEGDELISEIPEIIRQSFVLERVQVDGKKLVMEEHFYELQQFLILETETLILLLNLQDFIESLIVDLDIGYIEAQTNTERAMHYYGYGVETTPKERVKERLLGLQRCLVRILDAVSPSILEFDFLNFAVQDLSTSLNFSSVEQKNKLAAFQKDMVSLSNDARRSEKNLALAEEISTLTRVIRGIEYPTNAMFGDLVSLQLKLQASVKELKPTRYISSFFN